MQPSAPLEPRGPSWSARHTLSCSEGSMAVPHARCLQTRTAKGTRLHHTQTSISCNEAPHADQMTACDIVVSHPGAASYVAAACRTTRATARRAEQRKVSAWNQVGRDSGYAGGFRYSAGVVPAGLLATQPQVHWLPHDVQVVPGPLVRQNARKSQI